MTSYNDGKWHGWNGGDCPVHPKTEVEAVCISVVNGSRIGFGRATPKTAGGMFWQADNPSAIVAFRVVKEYREPREFWIQFRKNGEYPAVHGSPVGPDCEGGFVIHVREVRE